MQSFQLNAMVQCTSKALDTVTVQAVAPAALRTDQRSHRGTDLATLPNLSAAQPHITVYKQDLLLLLLVLLLHSLSATWWCC
jgi:hypothetical protein